MKQLYLTALVLVGDVFKRRQRYIMLRKLCHSYVAAFMGGWKG